MLKVELEALLVLRQREKRLLSKVNQIYDKNKTQGSKVLNQTKSWLKSAWEKLQEVPDATPTLEDIRTTDMTNFKMGIVADTLSGPKTQHKNQEFSLKRSNLNPRQGLIKNSLLGQGYGGAGGYKV